MTIVRLADVPWTTFRDRAGDDFVAILPVGAIEAHGPHLPLGTDVVIAEAMAESAASILVAGGREVLLLPPLVYSAAPFAAAFGGTVSISTGAVVETLVDIGRSLPAAGARVLAIANAHLDPAHRASIDRAAGRLEEEGRLRVAAPDIARRPWARRLTEEFRSGACHAGRYETSIVMAARPDLVDDGVRAGLPPNPASLSDAISDGRTSFADAGGADAYFGWPADASAEEGRVTIATLGKILAESVENVLAAPGAGG